MKLLWFFWMRAHRRLLVDIHEREQMARIRWAKAIQEAQRHE
jgi:hypothetical protein